MSRYFDLHATRNFGRKLNAVIEFIRYNSMPFGKSMLFIAGPFILLGSILLTQFMNQTIMQAVRTTQGNAGMENFDTVTILSMLGGFVAVFLGSIALISTVYEYIRLYDERKSNAIEVNEVWDRVKKNMWGLLLTMIVFAALLVVSYLLYILVLGLMVMIHPVLMILGLIILMIGIFFLMAYFMLVLFIQVYEGKGLSNAFQRATFLIRDNLWSTVAIIFITSLIQSTISTAFMIPAYINIIVYTIHSAESGAMDEPGTMFMVINYISIAIYLLANYILYAIPLLGVAFQYFNLAEKKEARGLMDKLETFGTADTSDQHEEYY